DAGSDFSPLTVFLAEDADSLDWSADFIHGSDITRVLLILRDEEQEEQEIEHEHLDLKQIATAGSDDLPTY
ncbi:hypothetical protein ACTUQ0_15210, partial [Listeria monocytogenes]|uniref:hypothetical protein n=1 Tax=Listeria monocytogenes TaxID=1639 RepID=UPI003FA433DA